MTPNEADCLDPQQRQLMETTYRALENGMKQASPKRQRLTHVTAGIPMYNVAGSDTSVYVGSMAREYDAMIQKDPERFGKYTATGTGPSMLANRLSWFYDFRGASLTLDTACSSGLYALDLACQDLCSGRSSMVSSQILENGMITQLTRQECRGRLKHDPKSGDCIRAFV